MKTEEQVCFKCEHQKRAGMLTLCGINDEPTDYIINTGQTKIIKGILTSTGQRGHVLLACSDFKYLPKQDARFMELGLL